MQKTSTKIIFIAFLLAGVFGLTKGTYAADVFYSVGQSTSDLKTGTPTITISSNVATFSVAQTGNIGAGDRVTYGRIDISSFADQGGGIMRITTSAGHGFTTGDYVNISGTTNYNGNYAISNATGNSYFDITATYVAEDGGATKYAANIAFISSKTSTAVWNLTSLVGSSVSDRGAATTVNSIMREYTSASNAEALSSDANHLNTSDLVTGNYVLNFPCYYDTGADTTELTIDGYTTGVSSYIKVYAPNNTSTEANFSQRHNGKWDDEKYSINIEAGGGINVNDNYAVIDGLQIEPDMTYEGARQGISLENIPSNSVVQISNNIIRPGSQYIGNDNGIYCPYMWGLTNVTVRIWNNIIYNFDNGGRGIYLGEADFAVYAYNNTLYNNSVGIFSTASSMVAKNNVAQKCLNGCYMGGAFNSSSTNNLSSDKSIPAYGTYYTEKTVPFVDKDEDDFHLSPQDTEAKNKGADLSADADLPFSADIDGHTRSTWDIGADETANDVFYSVGQNTTDHSSGGNVSITSGVATFTVAQDATNLGVGDVLTAGGNIYYLASKNSTTSWDVVTNLGAVPADLGSTAVTSIAHAFNSLSAAEAGADDASYLNTANLVTGNYVLNIPCYYDSEADTTAITIDGYATGPSNYIKIYAPKNTSTEVNQSQRHQGKWDEGKYRLETSLGMVLNIEDPYVRISGLQVRYSGSGNQPSIRLNEKEITVENSIMRNRANGGDYQNSGIGLVFEGLSSYSSHVYNNIIYEAYDGITNYYADYGTIYAYNNTVFGVEDYAFRHASASGSSFVAKNNIAQDCSSGDCYNGTFHVSSDYNISDIDAADAPNATFADDYATVSFADESADDFHLSLSDSAAKNLGTNLSADANLAFEEDIDGKMRNVGGSWDIGADEAGTTVRIEGGVRIDGGVKVEKN